jgi:hypothetical protein
MRGRKRNPGTITFGCHECGKKVVYRSNPSDSAGLANRVAKSGKTLKEFADDFICTACHRIEQLTVPPIEQ